MITEFKVYVVVVCVDINGTDFNRFEIYVKAEDQIDAVNLAKQSAVKHFGRDGKIFTDKDIKYAAISGTQRVFEWYR